MTNKITVSAPGKLMLYGEHAVVYGRPCIVTAVGQRMYLTAEFIPGKSILHIKAPDVKANIKIPISDLGNKDIPKSVKFIAKAVETYLEEFVDYEGGIKITTRSEFSSKFGFGSSSAVTVCTYKALSIMFEDELSNEELFSWSYKTVLDIQGTGSGFDVAAAVFGKTLYYITPGKVIEPLNIDSLPLIVGYSGIKTDTVTLINEVSVKAKNYPEVIENIYDVIGKLVNQAKQIILSKDWVSLGEIMNFNEGYLSALGVEGQKLADMIYSARNAGAYGAKLSGAGIGDCMISFAPEDKVQAVKDGITAAGGQIIDVESNVEGVRIEK